MADSKIAEAFQDVNRTVDTQYIIIAYEILFLGIGFDFERSGLGCIGLRGSQPRESLF